MNTYLFDFDGTPVDSMPTCAALMLRIPGEHGMEYGQERKKQSDFYIYDFSELLDI